MDKKSQLIVILVYNLMSYTCIRNIFLKLFGQIFTYNYIFVNTFSNEHSSSSSASTRESASSAAHGLAIRRRTLRSQSLDAIGASGGGVVRKRSGIQISVEIRVGQLGSDGQPSRPNALVAPENVQTSSAQAKVFDDVKQFDGLVVTAKLLFLRDDQVNVHVGMNKVAIGRPAHRALDAHQTVLFGPLEHSFRLEDLRVAGILVVGANPANVLASPEAPFAQAIPSHVQTLAAATPQEHEAPVRRHLTNVQRQDLVPRPELTRHHARHRNASSAACILLQRRFDQHHVELGAQRLEVERLQIGLQVHRRRGRVRNQIIFESDQFAQLGILFEAIGQTDVADKVLRSLARVHKVLAVVVVRIRRLGSLTHRDTPKYTFNCPKGITDVKVLCSPSRKWMNRDRTGSPTAISSSWSPFLRHPDRPCAMVHPPLCPARALGLPQSKGPTATTKKKVKRCVYLPKCHHHMCAQMSQINKPSALRASFVSAT